MLKKPSVSDLSFAGTILIFIVVLAYSACVRGGRDLKVFLFGSVQVLQQKSPYENPQDPSRPIYRYAPFYAAMQMPFLLKSQMFAPYEFNNFYPSILLWYIIKILALFLISVMLLRLIPSTSKDISWRNLKISILISLPFIGYELSNSQNKLIALFFILGAVFLFENDKLLFSSLLFCLALVIYIPLLSFAFYFVLRRKKGFILKFVLAAIAVFFVLPAIAFGPKFSFYLFKQWYLLTLKPFFFPSSYASYIDLRGSSQSLPSAVGRVFVSGKTGAFHYLISPLAIHIIIRLISVTAVLASCFVAWKGYKDNWQGFNYSIFLILALILPQYCIYYTWAWMLVFYFALLNFLSFPEVPKREKIILSVAGLVSYVSFCSIGIHKLNHISFMSWGTVLLWLALIICPVRRIKYA